MIDLEDYFEELRRSIGTPGVNEKLVELCEKLEATRESGSKVLLFGNGAAASIASHAALDLTKQAKVRSVCFHDASLLTAFGNDYGFDAAFMEIVRAYADSGDMCIFISVSGESPNVVRAAEFAKDSGLFIAAFSGRYCNNSLAALADLSFWVDSHAYNIVENTHSAWLLSTVDYLLGQAVYEVS